MEEARYCFSTCVGVEPSEKHCASLHRRGFRVIQGTFDRNLALPFSCDVITAFQVFEHLTDVYAALDYAYECLSPGGIMLINVPDGGKILQEGLYHQVIGEHVNYFTVLSLAAMAHHAGFDILEIQSLPDWLELDLYLRKPAARTTFNDVRKHQRAALQHLCRGKKNIVIWGAGTKSSTYAPLVRGLPIRHVVDKDTRKRGLYISDLPYPVEPVTQGVLAESDAVIIFASSYNAAIVEELRRTWSYGGSILCFEGEDVRACD